MALTGDRIRIIAFDHTFFLDGKTTGRIISSDGRGHYFTTIDAEPLVAAMSSDEPGFIVLPREPRP